MSSIPLRHTLRTLPVLAAGIIGCGGEQSPNQPAAPAFAAVSAGGRHTCGVRAAGAAYCWDDNVVGQLGDETTTQRLTPVRVVQ